MILSVGLRAAFAFALREVAAAVVGPELLHETVDGGAIETVSVQDAAGGPAQRVAVAELGNARAPGVYVVTFAAKGAAILVPHCAGRGRVSVDGVVIDAGSKGPLVVRASGSDSGKGHEASHDVRVAITVSAYEKRIACSEAPRAGTVVASREGLVRVRFTSPNASAGGGEAVMFVPRGHDVTAPGALLVGTHPWNGGPWTYAAYRELLEQAQSKDVVLLMPSGLGNSLYTERAEDEVMRAIDVASALVAVDRQRVSIWGASMGGAGATTIAFHHPDHFAFVASYFGDSKYDLTTYVRALLPSESAARKVNALDVVENARHVPVWLIHGENDKSSPVAQSLMLYDAMKQRGMQVEFDRVPGMGHEAPLVVKFLRRVVDRAAAAHAPAAPARVSFRATRSTDTEAYGVRLVRARPGTAEAFVDIERRADGVHVLRADGVRELVIRAGALGTPPLPREGAGGPGGPVHLDPGVRDVSVRWESP